MALDSVTFKRPKRLKIRKTDADTECRRYILMMQDL